MSELDPSHPPLFLSSRLLWSEGLSSAARLAYQLGYQGLEIWSEHAWRDGSTSHLRHELGRVPLQYVVHAPFMDLNICSCNPRVARLSIQECIRAFSLAHAVSASVVVVHPGRSSTRKESLEEYWPHLIEALAELGRRASRYGLILAVENMEPRPQELVVAPEDAQRLLQSVNNEGVQLCLDLAHAALINVDAPAHFIQICGPLICHVHLSNIKDGQPHFPLDEGVSPLQPRIVQFLRQNFTGAITVEGATQQGKLTAETGLLRLVQLLSGWKEVRESVDSLPHHSPKGENLKTEAS